MTTITDHDLEQFVTPDAADLPTPIEKVSIVISKGSLEGVYPGLIIANGARIEGIEANVFFTFFGLDAVTKKRHGAYQGGDRRKPGMHIPTLVGTIPGMSWVATKMMARKMREARHPARARVRRVDRRFRRPPLRVQGHRRHVRPRRRRLRAARGQRHHRRRVLREGRRRRDHLHLTNRAAYAGTARVAWCATILRFTRWNALSIVFVSQSSSTAIASYDLPSR